MQKKIRICLEVQGLVEDELGTPFPAGVCLTLGDEDAEEMTGAEYDEFIQKLNIEDVLQLLILDKEYAPADCRFISPEEYDRKYGE